MIKKTFNLNELFTLDTGFYGWCLDIIGEIIPNVSANESLQTNFTNYMLKPLWRKYQYVNANYCDDSEGYEQFKNDFANQLQDVCVEFYTYTKANVKHFEGLDNKTDLIKQVSSVVAPINDIIDQTATDTALAKGTTAQNIGTTLYNDSVWLSMFNTYMTPQRKGEMLNRFAWLFIMSYDTFEYEEEEEYVLEVNDTLRMGSGDQVIEFAIDEDVSSVVVTIEKPTAMIPRNIVEGVNIGGVIGNYEGIIPEGTIEITTNGEVNVSTYEKANVNVEGIVPTGTIELTENGDFYVAIYERANVNVPRPQLFAPVISLEGNILTISDDNNGDFVNTYRVLVDGVEKVGYNYTFSEIDLSTLELEDGTYTITIVATGIDFVDSVESNGVSYVRVNPKHYLTFSKVGDGTFTLNIGDNIKYWDGILEYSTDTNTWNTWDGTTTLNSSEDGKLYMRGTGNTIITGANASLSVGSWLLNSGYGNMNCIGNIEYLLDYQTVANGEHPAMGDYCFSYMFYGNSSLLTPPELPATTLSNYCYQHMFGACAYLSTSPELPATTLSNYCYRSMFSHCINLRTLPKLPAINITTNCYRSMFSECDNIKISTTQTDEYQNAYRIPTSGEGTGAISGMQSALVGMFSNTGGTFTGTPTANTTYYTSNEIV